VQVLRLQRRGAADIVLVEAVAAVDDNVAGAQQAGQRRHRVFGRRAGGQHHPDRAGGREPGHQRLQVRRRRRPVRGQRLGRLGAAVVDDAFMASAHQSPGDVAAHAAESDHPELHSVDPLVSFRCADGSVPMRDDADGAPVPRRFRV
jgi:hypothetical protein